jgi:hypothetical protein
LIEEWIRLGCHRVNDEFKYHWLPTDVEMVQPPGDPHHDEEGYENYYKQEPYGF